MLDDTQVSRLVLATLPTPLEDAGELPSGRRLLLKRDDLTGLGVGGNKARKLEYLCADAVRSGADVLVTVGAGQSNHARMTAAAGARLGLETHLVLGGSPQPEGNQLLAQFFGATLHFHGDGSWHDLHVGLTDLGERFEAQGRRPYVIPMGGSTPIGVLGFVDAWFELLTQLREVGAEPAAVYTATSTGGTHAGMMAGRAVYGGPAIVAVDVAKSENDIAEDAVRLATAALEMRGEGDATGRIRDSLRVERQFAGSGYAQPTAEADDALRWLAAQGGWVLDRVYTAKAFSALLSHDRDGSLDGDSVVFWHTGGLPSFFVTGGAPPAEPSPRETRCP